MSGLNSFNQPAKYTALEYILNVVASNKPQLLLLQAVIALMEMGFDEKEVIDALRVNNNQQDAAVGSPSAQLPRRLPRCPRNTYRR